jgi:integrase
MSAFGGKTEIIRTCRNVACRREWSSTNKESFGNLFRKACRAAGLRNRSPHGLRKIAATRAADAGATEKQLMAIFGWTDGKMAAHYTKSADRRRLSQGAMHMLARTAGAMLPLPSGQTTRT